MCVRYSASVLQSDTLRSQRIMDCKQPYASPSAIPTCFLRVLMVRDCTLSLAESRHATFVALPSFQQVVFHHELEPRMSSRQPGLNSLIYKDAYMPLALLATNTNTDGPAFTRPAWAQLIITKANSSSVYYPHFVDRRHRTRME